MQSNSQTELVLFKPQRCRNKVSTNNQPRLAAMEAPCPLGTAPSWQLQKQLLQNPSRHTVLLPKPVRAAKFKLLTHPYGHLLRLWVAVQPHACQVSRHTS